VTANFAGNTNYPAASGTETIVIQQATTSVSVFGAGTFTYNGSAYPATATVHDDSNNLDLPSAIPTITYSPGGPNAPVDAGTYLVTATYDGDTGHSSSSTTATIVIQQATTSVTVVGGGSFLFDGNPHAATASVHDDQNNLNLPASPVITYTPGGSNPPVTAGTYLATATFAGDAGHAGSTASTTITITQPTPNLAVFGGTFTYDGNGHTASATVTDSATNQPIAGAVATITYSPGGSTPPVTPGTYSVMASFAGNATYPPASASGTIEIDKANLFASANNLTKSLNAPNPTLTGSLSGAVSGDGLGVTFTTTAVQNSPVGTYAVNPLISDPLGRLAYYNVNVSPGTLKVVFGSNSGILQPINADGSSVCKQGSTVPAKFKVYDANGVSIGAPGTIVSFNIVQIVNGTVTTTVNETVDSTTPDNQFRWDGSQWIFNISTKNMSANQTYYFQVVLADGSTVNFRFGLR
jgi:hypothetical protein